MALREIIARFGIKVDSRQLKKADRGIGGLTKSLGTLGGLFAAGAILRGLQRFGAGAIDMGDNIDKTSRSLGVHTDGLQRLRSAANLAGVDQEKLDKSLKNTQKSATLAAQGSKTTADAYERLGVDIRDANGRMKDGESLFVETGVALSKLEDSTERVGLANQLMGRSGAELGPMFEQGAAGIAEANKRFLEFGGPVSKEFIDAAAVATDHMADFDLGIRNLKVAITAQLLPALSWLVDKAAKVAAALSKNETALKIVTAATLAFTVAMTALVGHGLLASFGPQLLASAKALGVLSKAFTIASGKVLIMAAGFLAVALTIEDFAAFLEGKESVIGTILDDILGKGTALGTKEALDKTIDSLAEFVSMHGQITIVNGEIDDNETRWVRLAATIASSTDDLADTWFFSAIGAVLDAIIGAVQWFASLWLSIFLGMVSAVVDAGSAIGSAFMSIVMAIGEAAVGAVEAAMQLGTDIIDGIINGIKAGAKAVAGAVGGVLDGAMKWGRGVIEAKSPSKRAGRELGAPITDGVAEGAMKAANAARRVTSAAIGIASGGGGPSAPRSGGASISNTININVAGGAGPGQVAAIGATVRRSLDNNRRATLAALRQQGAT